MMQKLAFTQGDDMDTTNFKEIQNILEKYKATLIQTENSTSQESFNLSKLLYELKQENTYRNISIELKLPNNLRITGPQEKFKHVLLNLFLNSVNAGAKRVEIVDKKKESS